MPQVYQVIFAAITYIVSPITRSPSSLPSPIGPAGARSKFGSLIGFVSIWSTMVYNHIVC